MKNDEQMRLNLVRHYPLTMSSVFSRLNRLAINIDQTYVSSGIY